MNFRGLILPVVLIGGAEILGRIFPLNSEVLGLPSDALAGAVYLVSEGELQARTVQTLISAGSGLAIGFTLGCLAGMVLGLFRTLDYLAEISVEAVRPVPAVALIPVALLAFGFGYQMEVFLVAFATFWPSLILARSAVWDVEPLLFDVAAALRLPYWQWLWKIMLPAAAPRILVAFRICLAIALLVAITVEVAVNNIGLGNGMMASMQSLHPEEMLAYLVWIGIVGLTLNSLTDVLLRKFHIHPMDEL